MYEPSDTSEFICEGVGVDKCEAIPREQEMKCKLGCVNSMMTEITDE